MNEVFELYCAVDIMGRSAVRLTRGDFDTSDSFGDPIELARRYVGSGARVLHVVDLDAARGEQPDNRAVVLAILDRFARGGVVVQVGGGARSREDVSDLLDAGAARVVVSTLAVEDPDLATELAHDHPGRIVLGVDHRPETRVAPVDQPAVDQTVAVRGWMRSSGICVEDLFERFAEAPFASVVLTSIPRDGTLAGPDTEGLRSALRIANHPVVASGGVRNTSDLRALASVAVSGRSGRVRRLAGAVVGKALAGGSLSVEEAIAACERPG